MPAQHSPVPAYKTIKTKDTDFPELEMEDDIMSKVPIR